MINYTVMKKTMIKFDTLKQFCFIELMIELQTIA